MTSGVTKTRRSPAAASKGWILPLFAGSILIPAMAAGAEPEAEAAFGARPYECRRHIRVDGASGQDRPGSDNDDKTPWKTLSAAAANAKLGAGDCVDVAPGLYTLGATLPLVQGGSGNSPGGYVAYRSTVPHGARLRAEGAGIYNLIEIDAPYIVIDGFEIDGNKGQIGGPAIDDEHGKGHHAIVRNNIIHDAGGSGIQLNDSDYFSIRGNELYRNAGGNKYQMSGISIAVPHAIQGFSPAAADNIAFHIVVANNISHDNRETFACASSGMKPHCHTDGNGIIIDFSLGPPGGAPYPYGILVQANLAYRNGGNGIQVGHSANVIVANNAVYDNNQDVENEAHWRGELNSNTSHDVIWKNNIAYSRRVTDDIRLYNTAISQGTTPGYSEANVSWLNNITFNGKAGDPSALLAGGGIERFMAENKAGVDPRFVDPAQGNFHLQPGSPALGLGIPGPEPNPVSLDGGPMPPKLNIGPY